MLILLPAAAVFENLDSSDVMETPAFRIVVKLLEVAWLLYLPVSIFEGTPEAWVHRPLILITLPRLLLPTHLPDSQFNPCTLLYIAGLGSRNQCELTINKVAKLHLTLYHTHSSALPMTLLWTFSISLQKSLPTLSSYGFPMSRAVLEK